MTNTTHDDSGFEEDVSPDHGESTTSGETRGTWETRCERLAVEMKQMTCGVRREVEDAMFSLLPPKVTRELIDAHKEVVRAGQRIGDMLLHDLEEKARRAETLHRKTD